MYLRMRHALHVFLKETKNVLKGLSSLVKFLKFCHLMNLKSKFDSILHEFGKEIIGSECPSQYRILISRLCIEFGFYRKASYFLCIELDGLERLKLEEKKMQACKAEVLIMIMECLGIRIESSFCEKFFKIKPHKPTFTKRIISFLLEVLYKINFSSDPRYSLCMLYYLSVAEEHLRKKVWEALVNCNPNLEGRFISQNYFLPFFSYLEPVPNPRQIKELKKTEDQPQLEGTELFIYDPRARVVKLNWCAQRSEEVQLFLYNPLGFEVVIDKIGLIVSGSEIASYSGRVVLKPYTKKRKVTFIVEIEKPGWIKFEGVSFTIRQMTYSMALESNGESTIVKNKEVQASELAEKSLHDLHRVFVYPPLPDIRSAIINEVSDVLVLGEEVRFELKLQNTSEIEAFIEKAEIILEFENSKPKACKFFFLS